VNVKMVRGYLPTGGVLEVDLPPPGFKGSAGTREYRWPKQLSWWETDRFGGKSQRRDATAERCASWWWSVCAAALMMRHHGDDVNKYDVTANCILRELLTDIEHAQCGSLR